MSKSQNQLAVNEWSDTRGIEHTALVLERQLMNTLELCWHVQQARIRPDDLTPVKMRRLFDGMSGELQIFGEMIRKRLESLCCEAQHFTEDQSDSSRHPVPSNNLGIREQLEVLLCAYACYARKTSKAIATLRRGDEQECRKLLETMFVAADRHMRFLEMYMEGLVLNKSVMRVPDWPTGTASENHTGR